MATKYEFVPVYIQSLYVQGTEATEPYAEHLLHDDVRFVSQNSGDPYALSAFAPISYVRTITSTSIPTVSAFDLRQNYEELGTALKELTRLDVDDEWRVDQPVFEAAKFVASHLASRGIPAPQLFNHGSHSIVFNWSNRSDNLYLTISADKISALLSTPSEIKRRAQISKNQLSQSHLLVLGFQNDGAPTSQLVINSSEEVVS